PDLAESLGHIEGLVGLPLPRHADRIGRVSGPPAGEILKPVGVVGPKRTTEHERNDMFQPALLVQRRRVSKAVLCATVACYREPAARGGPAEDEPVHAVGP